MKISFFNANYCKLFVFPTFFQTELNFKGYYSRVSILLHFATDHRHQKLHQFAKMFISGFKNAQPQTGNYLLNYFSLCLFPRDSF